MESDDEAGRLEEEDLSTAEATLLKAFEASVERANAREWAVRKSCVDLDTALAQVKRTLQEQLIRRDAFNDRKALLLHGALAIDEVFDPVPPSEDALEAAVTFALDDPTTFRALRTLSAIGYAKRSPALQRFQTLFLAGLIKEPKSRPGPPATRDTHRNMVIASQVEQLALIGVPPTRSSATEAKTSGCDLVCDVLAKLGGHNLTYAAIERVWKERTKRPQPHFFAELLTTSMMTDLTFAPPSD